MNSYENFWRDKMKRRAGKIDDKAARATRYIEFFAKDLLKQEPLSPIPYGWAPLVIEMLTQLRTCHPGTTITSMNLAPISNWSRGQFAITFQAPSRPQSLADKLKTSHSLEWLVRSFKQRALATCSVCGHPLGSLRHQNLCSLCACRNGLKEFK